MRLEHLGDRPRVHESAYVAPTAALCGDVTIGENSRVLFGATLVAEGGSVVIGSNCVVMENAVLRGTPRHPLTLGDDVLVGPRAYLTGCEVASNSFLATGATVFNGARIGAGSEVRINGVVHLKTVLPENSLVPIGWVSVGDPAKILSPERHDEIWELQEPLDFPGTVFGVERSDPDSMMPEVMRRYTRGLARHLEDHPVD